MNIEISILSNGLTIISDPMANLESAALGVWVGTGSRDELPPEMGISHMLEHMAFKGTATRSARAIAEEDRKSTRLNSSHYSRSRMPSSA